MKLSIIVPVYNVENYIRECLDSIVASLYVCGGSVEVIIVDDGSTDSCREIVDEYKTLEWSSHMEYVVCSSSLMIRMNLVCMIRLHVQKKRLNYLCIT